MKLTVKEILNIEQLKTLQVVAGSNGLSNAVEGVSVLEIPGSNAAIKSGHILVSAFYSIAHKSDEQLGIIRMMCSSKASGLILCHVGMILPFVSRELIDVCTELELPLIVAPAPMEYIDIISPILDRILEKRNEDLMHAMDVYDKMTNLILEENNADCIVAALGRLLNRTVCFFSHNSICISASQGGICGKYNSYIKQKIDENFERFIKEKRDIEILLTDNSTTILLSPIVSSMMYYGVLVVFNASDLRRLDYISIRQAKNSLAIITINKTNLKDYNNLLKNDFIKDLIAWNFKDEQDALKRSSSLGFDIARIQSVIALDIFTGFDDNKPESEEQLKKLRNDLYCLVLREVRRMAEPSIVASHENKILIFLNIKSAPLTRAETAKIAELLRNTARSALGNNVSAGVSLRRESLSSIKKSCIEAVDALMIGNKIFCSSRTVFYEEVEIFGLLMRNMDCSKAKEITQRLFGPIISYDRENNGELLETFKILLMSDSDTTEVADRMFLHKNTVLQRKKKIISLYGYDPFAIPYRLQFEFAIMLCSLYGL